MSEQPDLSHITEDLRPLAVPIGDLMEDPLNINIHERRSIEAIKGSLARYGQRKPIVVNRADHNIVEAGNGTLISARHLGWTHIAVVFVEDDPTTHTGFAIADNRAAQLAFLDDEVLGKLLANLEVEDPDQPLTAMWEDAELKALLARAGVEEEPGAPDDAGAQIDRAEELQAKWQVAPGDLWMVESKATPGQHHRLACGDCRDWATVARLCNGVRAQGIFTSPPYAEQRKTEYGGVPADEYVGWWEAVQANVGKVVEADGSFFVNLKAHTKNGERALYVMDLVIAMKRSWSWRFIEEYAWKHQGVPGAGGLRLKNQFEPVYQFSRGKPALRQDEIRVPASESHLRGMERKRRGYKTPPGASPFTGGRVSENFDMNSTTALPGNVIKVNNGGNAGGLGGLHPASFPVDLPHFFMRAYGDPGGVWLDPFMGSGTVMVAAEQTRRVAFGVELLPAYVAVILERLSGMGLEPQMAKNVQEGSP